MGKRTYYDILGVSRNASRQEIREAYVHLIKQYHPDVNPNREEATRQTQIINEAYAVLRDSVKRLEYDNLLLLEEGAQPSKERVASDGTRETTEPPEIPHFCCEKCGRRDSTLRVTIFLWVFSVIVLTYKKGWGHILCSHCRIKYSLLFNLEVLLFGWWGFPFGIIYSIEALFRNLIGGIQPPENNASLLAILAYDFYTKGNYSEAYRTLSVSYKLKPTPEAKEFLDFLRPYAAGIPSRGFADRLLSINPAWYNLPLILAFFLFVGGVVLPGLDTGSDYHSQYVSSQAESGTPADPDRGMKKAAKSLGVDLDAVEQSVQGCNEVVRDAVAYMHSRVPMVGTSHRGNTIIRHYELDRSKLEAATLGVYTESARGQCRNVLRQTSCSFASGASSGDEESLKRLKGYLKRQKDFARSSYFNLAMLYLSVSFYNDLESHQNPAMNIMRIQQLSRDRMLKDWLLGRPEGKKHAKVVALLDDYGRILQVRNRLRSLSSRIETWKSSINSLKKRLDQYKSFGMYDEYNALVPEYNSLVRSAKRSIREYNGLVSTHNRLLRTADRNKLEDAFNSCLDPAIFLSQFDTVNLDSNEQRESNTGEITFD